MSKKVVRAEMSHPDNAQDVIHIKSGELFKPPIWSFRKAVAKLAELYPETVAKDLWMIIKERPYGEDEQYEWISYREEIIPYIWYLYTDFEKITRTPVDTVLLWIIRCSHYYWFSGPKPSRKYQPRKKKNNLATEIWREKLTCPTCLQVFTYDGIKTDTREDVMKMYNKWLSQHTKICANIVWNRVSDATKKKISKEVEAERRAKEEADLVRYEEWKSRLPKPVSNFNPVQLEWETYLNTVRKGMRIIRGLMQDEKNKAGDVVRRKNIPEAIFRLKLLTKYVRTHAVTPDLRREFYDLCDDLNVERPKNI